MMTLANIGIVYPWHEQVALVAIPLALIPVLLYVRNVRIYTHPPLTTETFSISVLIPARNEATSITVCVESVLKSVQVELELIVLDDASTDNTAAIVQAIAERDPRVRLASAPTLPEGWSGKQHACFVLSKLASKPILVFLDADVRIAPDALARLAAFQKSSRATLVSGFPRQETGTFFEKLVIPLIHFILLAFLPLRQMRSSPSPSFGAGCGQIFLTTADAYSNVGGHESIKTSFHDGVKLPRAYRSKYHMTDLCDLTDLAICRMYSSAGQVWRGFAKNASEGLGSAVGIWFWTLFLIVGQVLPFYILLASLFPESNRYHTLDFWIMPSVTIALLLMMRLHLSWRFRQPVFTAFLHPLAVVVLLSIQWYAWCLRLVGVRTGWKGRTPPT